MKQNSNKSLFIAGMRSNRPQNSYSYEAVNYSPHLDASGETL